MKHFHRLSWGIGVLGAAVIAPGMMPSRVAAQSSLPICPPPASQEYLLLVRGDSESERARIADALPVESTVLVCQYVDEVVVRAGGFTSLETANAWATYMNTVEGFESFVSRPAGQPGAVASVGGPADGAVPGDSSRQAMTYQPRQLEGGYAVLVEYGNRPEIATTIGQIVRPVGLAVYQQRAYLLATHTADATSAENILQRLSDAQLAAILVDAQAVVQLSPEVERQ